MKKQQINVRVRLPHWGESTYYNAIKTIYTTHKGAESHTYKVIDRVTLVAGFRPIISTTCNGMVYNRNDVIEV